MLINLWKYIIEIELSNIVKVRKISSTSKILQIWMENIIYLFSQNELQMIASGYYGYIVLFRSLFTVLFLDIITPTFFSMALYLCIPLESVKYTGTKFLSRTRNRVTRIITANIRFMIIMFVINQVKLIEIYLKFSSYSKVY